LSKSIKFGLQKVQSKEEENKMALGNKKILIIDDDPDFVRSTEVMLRSENYDTVDAPDGKTGIEKAKEEKPDLILVDIMMETWGSGFKVVDKLRQNDETKDIPMIMISAVDIAGKTNPYPGEEWFKSGDVMLKPIKKDELIANVSRLLSKKA
jgi:CheY-like chemotaxis protein